MDLLTKPIEPNEIEWKIQSYTKGEKVKTIIVPYVTARCVMDRFDEQFGVMGWQTKFREVNTGVICTLSVWEEVKDGIGEWITKEDGASLTKIEPLKGGISDSLKRAAHQFGLGRDLYSYPRVMLNGEHKYIPDEVHQRLDKMVELINKGEFTQKVVVI